ncbi:MAG TPA: hypothetical protein VMU73_08390 [Gaiellaceae bacterium]|nr:hypothetical protein [Gaiellaceae bacterium]
MSDEPTPRELALRFLAAFHAGPDAYRTFIAEERLALPLEEASDVIHELVQIAYSAIAALSKLRGVEDEDALDSLLIIERTLDDLERKHEGDS